jgi:hypothetical protein
MSTDTARVADPDPPAGEQSSQAVLSDADQSSVPSPVLVIATV